MLLPHDSAWPHISVRTTEAVIVFGSTVLADAPRSHDTAPSDSHIFESKKEQNATVRTTRHYITPCVSCCRENTATFTGLEYVSFFEDVRPLTMGKTVLTHKSACSNIVVKSCEIFRYLNYIS